MTRRGANILVVEDDLSVAGMLCDHLSAALACQVRCVQTAADAVVADLGSPADVVLAEVALPDADGLNLTRDLRVTNDCPVVLMASRASLGMAVQALRHGVFDLLIKPFDLGRLTKVMCSALARGRALQQQRCQARRYRLLARRLIRERRTLRRQVDLISQELVQAYQHLAETLQAPPDA